MRICIQGQGAWIMLLNKKCPYNLQYSIQMEKLPFDQLLAISRDRRTFQNRSKSQVCVACVIEIHELLLRVTRNEELKI